MSSFKWKNGTVFISPATGRTRATYNYLRAIAGIYDMDNAIERTAYNQACMLLSRVKGVEGNIGFHVPNGDATPETVTAFCEALLDAPESLWVTWDDAVIAANAGDNDPALLPPDELSDDEKKTTKKKDDSKESVSKSG